MNADELLDIVERSLLSRSLTAIERLVLRQSWHGQTYTEMASNSGYDSAYIKEVGSQLWQDLSVARGERVTKKNLHLVFTPSLSAPQYSRSSPCALEERPPIAPPFIETVLPAMPEFPGDPLPLNSPLYIERPPIEALTQQELSKPGCLLRIKAPKKMGKSSLLNRMQAYAQGQGYRTVYLDFREADASAFTSLDRFLRWFCANVSRQLNLNPALDDYWDEDIGSKVSCKLYFEGYLLASLDRPLVLTLNEVNRVFEYRDIAQEFLPMLRFWHEQSRTSDIWKKLRMVLAHATEIYVPLKLNQSPFNVGVAIALSPFDGEQVRDLARRYGLDWPDSSEVDQLMAMVGGHPYLIDLALYHLVSGEESTPEAQQKQLSALLQDAPTQTGIYRDHLRGLLAIVQEQPQLASILQEIVTAQESIPVEAIGAYKLESLGLVKLEGNLAQPSCQLYRLYFSQQLANWSASAAQPADPNTGSVPFSMPPVEASGLDFGYGETIVQLPDRSYLNQYIESRWQSWSMENTQISLILTEIDYFKFYEEAFGRIVAYTNLQRIAKTFRACIWQSQAWVAQYEYIKFAAILPKTPAETAVDVAHTICSSIEALQIAHDLSRFDGFSSPVLTMSLGVASMTCNANSSSSLLAIGCEQALAQSKREGRDRVTVRAL
jgi:diguanylate cyclase (GGDEF)-like protein